MRSEGKFYDDKNFPRGFNRSGVFTVNEAMLLENYGRTMRGLSEGTLEPVSESELEFLSEISGERELSSNYARCWLKYIQKTTTKYRSYTLCASPRKAASTYDDNESDGDNDLDY